MEIGKNLNYSCWSNKKKRCRNQKDGILGRAKIREGKTDERPAA
jgi:hypothetical protein